VPVQDTHDLFATLIVSLDLSTHSRFFRSYPNSFTTDDAAANLASLRFSQSNRTPDPNDPSRIVTTTTTTTFSMPRAIAKTICQHFMDARLIENAAEPAATTFKDRGIWCITPKGLHVLERFITKNGIASDHLVRVFTSQPICAKLLHLERRPADDEILISRSVVDVVFRRFAGGKHPNYVVDPEETARLTNPRPFVESAQLPAHYDRANGVDVQDVVEKGPRGGVAVVSQVFASTAALEWLVDFSTVCSRDEAGEVCAHFIRCGLVVLYQDRSRPGDRLAAVTVDAPAGQAGQGGQASATYKWGSRILYRVTDEGRRVAGSADSSAGGTTVLVSKSVEAAKMARDASFDAADDSSSSRSAGHGGGGAALSDAVDSQLIANRARLADLFRGDLTGDWTREQHSSSARLKAILDEPALRALFRDFLRANYCDENLGFWLDVADFRRRFSTTSTAVGGRGKDKDKDQAASDGKAGGGGSAMEQHQQHLVVAAMSIYHTYLAPLSPNELNIDYNLRGDVVNFISKVETDNGKTPRRTAKAGAGVGVGEPGDGRADGGKPVENTPPLALRATQVQTLLRHYERVQDHIFRLLATDQVPRFTRTPRFLELMDHHHVSLFPALSTRLCVCFVDDAFL
jgi:hypothetical protein